MKIKLKHLLVCALTAGILVGSAFYVTKPIVANANEPLINSIGVYSKEIIDAKFNALTEKVEKALKSSGVVGTMQIYAGSDVPEGYLLCDGREVSREEYADLFKAIGTTWGAGDGSTTFNVPDMREVAPVGVGTSSRNEPAHDTFLLGEFKDDQLQSHTHSYTAAANSSQRVGVGSYPIGNAVGAYYTFSTNGVNTGRSGTVTRGKRIGVNYIIKY
jgi:microcystin-dependent protein